MPKHRLDVDPAPSKRVKESDAAATAGASSSSSSSSGSSTLKPGHKINPHTALPYTPR